MAPTAPPSGSSNQGLLICAWIFAIIFPLVGLILAIIGKNKGDARFKPPMIVAIVLLALTVVYYIYMFTMM